MLKLVTMFAAISLGHYPSSKAAMPSCFCFFVTVKNTFPFDLTQLRCNYQSYKKFISTDELVREGGDLAAASHSLHAIYD
jgi:hypothetical protein